MRQMYRYSLNFRAFADKLVEKKNELHVEKSVKV